MTSTHNNKIGLLQCCHVNDSLKHIDGDYDDMFQKALGDELEFKVFYVVENQFPQNIDNCDGYLISGAKASVHDNTPWIQRLISFVQKCHDVKKKVVGICFGHQVIAKALGGKTALSEKGWGIGSRPVNISQQPYWMSPPRNRFNILYSHRDQVTQLPPEAKCIGSNEHCEYAMMQIGEHIMSMQGHPEFSPEYAMPLTQSRVDKGIINSTIYQKAKNTFFSPLDNTIVNQWIVHFFKGTHQ